MTVSGRARAEGGFTLLEVLVSPAILALAVVTILELSSQSLRLVKTSGDYQQAVQIADRIARDTQASEEGVESGEEGPFQWERRISLVSLPDELQPKETIPGREPAKLFAVTIDVRWGRNQGLQLATLQTPTITPTSSGTQQSTVGGPQSSTLPGTRLPGAQFPAGGMSR